MSSGVFRSYSDSPQRTADLKDGQLVSTVTQNIAIVPDEEGSLLIEPLELVIFDTEEEQYMTLRTAPLTLEVEKGMVRAEGFQQFSETSAGQTRSKSSPRLETLGVDLRSVDATVRVQIKRPWECGFAEFISSAWSSGRSWASVLETSKSTH